MKAICAILFTLLTLCVFSTRAATLLPNGEQVFLDQNGAPLAGGKVYFYIPNTLSPKATYQNSGSTVSNTNPVTLDGSGRAIIYGSGSYRQQVYDQYGNLIWDQITADTSAAGSYSWAGTSSGTAGTQTLTAPNFSFGDGQQIGFIAGFSNSGPFNVVVNGASPTSVVQASSIGPQALGIIVAGNQYFLSYSATNGNFQIDTLPQPSILSSSPIVAASTTDLGTLASQNGAISGSTTINSFGSSASVASQFYFVTFSGSPTISASASILTPTGRNLQPGPGANAFLAYLGGGVWQVVSYNAGAVTAHGQAYFTATSTTTVTLNPKGGDFVTIDGADYQISSAGISATITSTYVNGTSGQSLSATPTLYYAYLANIAGTLTIDWSTTGHSTDTTAGNVGVEVKTGDSTRTLIGMAYTQAGPVFAQSGANILVISWFNKSGLAALNHFTTGRSTTSSSYTEVNSEIRDQFLIWAGDTAQIAINGSITSNTAMAAATAIGIDSTTVPQDAYIQGTVTGTTQSIPAVVSETFGGLSEGFHYATLLGLTSAGAPSWSGGASPGARTTLNVGVRG